MAFVEGKTLISGVGRLEDLLQKRRALSRGHALEDVPAYVADLREREAMAARALEFTILPPA